MLDEILDALAARIAALLPDAAAQPATPWMDTEGAIAYTQMRAGTFREWVAAGRFIKHGGKRALFHRDELDRALGYVPPGITQLRRAA